MLASLALLLWATPSTDPAWGALDRAYEAGRRSRYEDAIAAFEEAVAIAPDRADVRKDFGYTLLKAGETEAARDQFAKAASLDPSDVQVALEYAFLCYETRRTVEARRTFDRIRKTGNPVAEQAYENIDRPLREGIRRWSDAIAIAPGNFSNHEELAKLAEQRDELQIAAEHFLEARKLRPDLRYLLVDLGRIYTQLQRPEDAVPYLLAASRGPEPRSAERAKALLPKRYPYVYEFRQAMTLDPGNLDLRRELAYLLLEMDRKDEAEAEFSAIVEAAPTDDLSAAQLGFLKLAKGDKAGAAPLLERALQSEDEELADRVRSTLRLPQTLRHRAETPRAVLSSEARALAERSFEKGYLKDALKYLRIAQEHDPVDFSVLLKLGWTNNMLHDDKEAVRWFKLAERSPDEQIASEARKARRNLDAGMARIRTTAWLFPFYSSRWHDAFTYGQVKTEFKLGRLPLRPYASVRLMGDLRERGPSTLLGPQYLSESSVILGGGVATQTWKGLTGWAEAGAAIRYVERPDTPRTAPDYRGGAAYGRGWGQSVASEASGFFFDTNLDGVYLSRFNNDVIGYAQTRTGWTTAPRRVRAQFYVNANGTTDSQRQPWANFIEAGPGVRFRFDPMPSGLLFMINCVRGRYTIREGSPYAPMYNDFRAGFWYAFTR